MRLEGRFSVKAARDEVYDFLTDPRSVSRHMPDVKDVEIEDSDRFTVKARVGISNVKGTMIMKLAITDRRPPISTTVTGRPRAGQRSGHGDELHPGDVRERRDRRELAR